MLELQRDRINRLKNWLNSEGIEAFLVSGQENRYYLSGFPEKDLSFTESSGMLLITPSDNFLITDFRYREAAENEAPLFNVRIYDKSMEEVICELLAEIGAGSLALEKDYITVGFFESLKGQLNKTGMSVELLPQSEVIENMRAVKSREEIKLMKKSLKLSEEVMLDTIGFIRKRFSEKEIAWFIEKELRERGAEELAFPPIVASGPNAALPHARPTEKIPGDGEPIIIDMGARLRFYCSDITRTFFMNKMPGKWQKIYEIVLEAQTRAQEAIKPGMKTSDVDAIARDVIERAGYGPNFGHGLGHGVGLAVHEKPALRKTKPTVLEPNMVITVEPGIYIPGEGGIRLENMVCVTDNGCLVLNEIQVEPVIF